MNDDVLRVIAIGDIFSKIGKQALVEVLPILKAHYNPHLIIANVENAAGGRGVSIPIAKKLHSIGVDVLTSGNHIWDQRDIFEYFAEDNYLLRPANYDSNLPGKGWCIFKTQIGFNIAIVNLQGRLYLPDIDCPFKTLENLLESGVSQTDCIIVDFHAEATSEKQSLARKFDGQISLLFGTHTHVATADETILPKGTGYITDIGMTGPHDSVIGMKTENAIQRFIYQVPVNLEPAKEDAQVNGIYCEISAKSQKCIHLNRFKYYINLSQ